MLSHISEFALGMKAANAELLRGETRPLAAVLAEIEEEEALSEAAVMSGSPPIVRSMAGNRKRLVYRGPAQQVCYDLVAHDYSPILVPDAVYELPDAFADRLLASNKHFEVTSADPTWAGGNTASGSALPNVNKES